MEYSFLTAFCLSLLITFFDELDDVTYSKWFLPIAFSIFIISLFYLNESPGILLLIVSIIMYAYRHVLMTSSR